MVHFVHRGLSTCKTYELVLLTVRPLSRSSCSLFILISSVISSIPLHTAQPLSAVPLQTELCSDKSSGKRQVQNNESICYRQRWGMLGHRSSFFWESVEWSPAPVDGSPSVAIRFEIDLSRSNKLLLRPTRLAPAVLCCIEENAT